MLFRLVSGQDLEELHHFLRINGGKSSKDDLCYWFIQRAVSGGEGTNLEEAITVLRSAGICAGSDPVSIPVPSVQPLQLQFLERLRAYEMGIEGGSHVLDAWYLRILHALFTAPDVMYINELHKSANRLSPPLPLSDEKLNSWRRVMEWLGVGRRLGVGFMAVCSENLIRQLLQSWGMQEGPLDDWVHHVERYLPAVSDHGDLSRALTQPLLCMESLGRIKLSARQDSPGKGYLGERRAKWISVTGGVAQ